MEKQDGRFVALVTKDLQTLNLKFDQVMFNSLVLMWERNFKVTFDIFSALALSSAEVIMIIKCQVSVSSLLLNIP